MLKNTYSTAAPAYRSYEDALDEITVMSKQRRLVFVIDEYAYLAKAENPSPPAFSISSAANGRMGSFI